MKLMRWSLALVMLTCMGCATIHRAGAPKGAINIIAHRGASEYAPENTLASFRLAHELGADWFELDCTLTSDGEIIVIHDDTTDRTTGVKGKISRMTLAEIKKLDAGSWKDAKFAGEQMPTLEESLALARVLGIGVYIEVKNSANDNALMRDIIKANEGTKNLSDKQRKEVFAMIRDSESRNYELTMKVIKLIRRLGMKRQVVLQSFSPIVCAVALHEAPGIRTELLCARDEKEPAQWEQFMLWEQLLHPAGLNPHVKSTDADLVARLHAEGKTIAVWTVDDEETMRALANLGVDSIITNKPDVCKRVLSQMGRR